MRLKCLQKEYQIDSEVWSVTSFSELRKNGMEVERYNLLHPDKKKKKSYIEECLGSSEGSYFSSFRLYEIKFRSN